MWPRQTGVGLSRGRAYGPHWETVAPGWFVPVDRPTEVEQRIVEQAARLSGSKGVVTGWAALRWHGAAYFDGRSRGREHPVELAVSTPAGNLRHRPGSIVNRRFIGPTETTVVAGLPVARVQRALFDEIYRRDDLVAAVTAIDMAAAAGLISAWLFAVYAAQCNAMNGAPLVREAVSYAVDETWSPREPWLRMVWLRGAGLPTPLVNHPIYDRRGSLIGIPDLLDPTAGLVAEYDGVHHRDRNQHRSDVRREELFRSHGLEVVTVVAGEPDEVVAARLRTARGRARFAAPDDRSWTTERPAWDPAPETLDARLERLGVAESLSRH